MKYLASLTLLFVTHTSSALASFSFEHDIYSKPEFVVLNNTSHNLLDNQVDTYIQSIKALTNYEVEFMKLQNDTYVCTLPILKQEEIESDEQQEIKTWSDIEQQEAKNIATEAMSVMSDKCIYFSKDWWTYSFCYGKDVMQFHLDDLFIISSRPPEPGPGVMSFVLGQFETNSNGTITSDIEVVSDGDVSYLSYTLNQGTVCDLTNKARSIEVQVYCNPKHARDSILRIQEVKSCKYRMEVSTNKICGHPVFAPPEKIDPLKLECRKIVSSQSLHKSSSRKKASEEAGKPESLNIQKEIKADQEGLYDLLYNDMDFDSSGPFRKLILEEDEKTATLNSYNEDLDHTLALLLKAMTDMIRSRHLKNSKGEHITPKHEFVTVLELLDLDGTNIIPIKFVLSKGDLMAEVMSSEYEEYKEKNIAQLDVPFNKDDSSQEATLTPTILFKTSFGSLTATDNFGDDEEDEEDEEDEDDDNEEDEYDEYDEDSVNLDEERVGNKQDNDILKVTDDSDIPSEHEVGDQSTKKEVYPENQEQQVLIQPNADGEIEKVENQNHQDQTVFAHENAQDAIELHQIQDDNNQHTTDRADNTRLVHDEL